MLFVFGFPGKLVVKHLLTHNWAKSPKGAFQTDVNYPYNQSTRGNASPVSIFSALV